MKKLHRFIFCLMLSCQIATGIFPVLYQNPNPAIQVMEENPYKDAIENA